MNERLESRLRRDLAAVDRAAVTNPDRVLERAAAISRRRQRSRRSIGLVAVAGIAAAAVASFGFRHQPPTDIVTRAISSTAVSPTSPPPLPVTTAPPAAVPMQSGFVSLPPNPRGVGSEPTVVWTGGEVIVIGGVGNDKQADAFDPKTNSWRALRDAPIASSRQTISIAVWDATEVLLLGTDGDANAYDPTTDAWRPLASPPAPFTQRTPKVWTGTELLVWPTPPGAASSAPLAYNPTRNNWREVTRPPLAGREQAASVWTGTEWILWGGTTGQNELDDGAAYNPVANTWRTVAASPLSPRGVGGVWTGSEMIVAAGWTGGEPRGGNGEHALADGAAYNPSTDRWRPIAAGPAHPGFTSIWTGTQMLMFAKGKYAFSYDVTADNWTENTTDSPNGSFDQPVWTGTNIVLIDNNTPLAFSPPTIRSTIRTATSPQPIVRPYVDPTVCNPLAATESTFSDHTWVPFARPSAAPLPIQAIGDPASGPAGPFAVVLRYHTQDRADQVSDPVIINGWAVGIRTFENGNGEAVWNLSDGTQGYLRSRGLDATALASIVARLTLRDRSAPVPGFDFASSPNGPPRLELLAEHLSTGLIGSGASIQCRVETTGFTYRISTIDGDPITRFLSVIDGPLPLEVAAAADRVIVIIGNPNANAPTAAQISNADPAIWSHLLAQPPP
jgi:hypothetical protein